MGLSEILGTLRDRPKSEETASSKMSKQLLGMTKSSNQTFNKLIKIQEKSPIQKRQLAVQEDLSKKISFTNKKMDSLTKTVYTQTLLLQQNQKILQMSNKYLESLDSGLKQDRRYRDAKDDEERRYKRKNLNSLNKNSKNLNKKPNEKKGGIFDTLAKLLGLSGLSFGEGLLTAILGSKIVKGIKAVGGFFTTVFNGLRGFLFGSKIIDETGAIISKTENIFARLSSQTKTVMSFLSRTGKMIYNLSKSALNYLKLPQIASSGLNTLKTIPAVSKTINAVGGVGSKVLNAGKSAVNFVKPALGVASNLGSKALGLGGKALTSISGFLAPTVKAGAKVGGGLLGKMLPGVGAAISVGTAISDFQKGDYLGTVINGLSAVTNFMGPLGMLTSGMLTVVDMVRKGEITGVFNTVTDGIKSVVNFVTNTFNPSVFIDGIKKWWGGTWLGRKIMEKSDPSSGGDNSSSSGGSNGGLMSSASKVAKDLYNYATGGGNSSGSSSTPNSNAYSSSLDIALKAIQKNESSNPKKIYKDNTGYAVGKYQINSKTNSGAWKQMGFTNEEIGRINSGDIGFAQAKLDANPEILAQADARQESVLRSGVLDAINLFQKNGADVSNPIVQAQFMDILNQYGPIGSPTSMDKETVQKMIKFSGGKKITPEGVYKWRMQTKQERDYHDQNRRYRTINDAFIGVNLSSLTPTNPTQQKNIVSNSGNSSSGMGFNQLTAGFGAETSTPSKKSETISAKPMSQTMPSSSPSGGSSDGKVGNPLGTKNPRPLISSSPGPRDTGIAGASKWHKGTDIVIPTGTPIYASYSGKVFHAGWADGYGNYVAIRHKGGYTTGYAHLSKINVGNGQKVNAGQQIGLSGNTGVSSAPHLHYELWKNGVPLDPFGRSKYAGHFNSSTNVGTDDVAMMVSANNNLSGNTSSSNTGTGNTPMESKTGTGNTPMESKTGGLSSVVSNFSLPDIVSEGNDFITARDYDYTSSQSQKTNEASKTGGLSSVSPKATSAPKPASTEKPKGTPITKNPIPNSKNKIGEGKAGGVTKGSVKDEVKKVVQGNKKAVDRLKNERAKSLKKTVDNLTKSVKNVKKDESKELSQTRKAMIKAIQLGFPKATSEQANLILDQLKIKENCKTDEDLLKILSNTDTITLQTMIKGYGLDKYLIEKKPSSNPAVKPSSSNPAVKPSSSEAKVLDNTSSSQRQVASATSAVSSLTESDSYKAYSNTGTYTTNQSSGGNTSSGDSTASGIFKGAGKAFFSAIGVPQASALLDILPNPVDALENIWNIGSAVFSGDKDKMQSAIANRKKSGIEGTIEGLFNGKTSVGDVLNTVSTVSNGLGLNLDTSQISNMANAVGISSNSSINLSELSKGNITGGLGIDTSKINAKGLANLVGIDTSNLAGQATDALSKATGLNVGGILSSIGIDSNQLLNNGLSSVNPTLLDSSSPELSTKSMVLNTQQAVRDSMAQEQIRQSLNSIDSSAQKTSTGVNTISNQTNKTSSKTKANLLNMSDIGTMHIQSNLLG